MPKRLTRKRRVDAFEAWMERHGACLAGRRFAKGKTAQEAWMACKTKRHAEFMRWFVRKTGLYKRMKWAGEKSGYAAIQCCCNVCIPVVTADLFRASVKLPRTFRWEGSR